MIDSFAVVLAAGGCVSLYLASPNQALVRHSLRPRNLIAVGASALAMAQALFLMILGAVAACFVLVLVAMIAFGACPFIGLFARVRRERADG